MMGAADREQANKRFARCLGQPCTTVTRHEYSWTFEFGVAGVLTAECPWRIIAAGRIALTDTDDRQQFGLPAPIDAETEARTLLVGRQISSVVVADTTADLEIRFDDGTSLELFNCSSGYEGWQAVVRDGEGNISIIALGGGGIAILGS